MKILCECNSFDCRMTTDMSYEESIKAHKNGGIIIVDGCPNGPEDNDELIKVKEMYQIYRER